LPQTGASYRAIVRDGEFRKLYSTELAFPPFDPNDVLNPGVPLTLALDYVDVADIATLAPPAAGATTLPVPRARDVRLRLTPRCRPCRASLRRNRIPVAL
jgi:hypothetical protein